MGTTLLLQLHRRRNKMIQIYYCTWIESSVSGNTTTGSELIQTNNKEEAKTNILKLNNIRKINSTNIQIYDFSKLCDKYNITYSFKKKNKIKKEENTTTPTQQIDEDIF